MLTVRNWAGAGLPLDFENLLPCLAAHRRPAPGVLGMTHQMFAEHHPIMRRRADQLSPARPSLDTSPHAEERVDTLRFKVH